MHRMPFLALIVSMLCSPRIAQEWADKMFTIRSYDFGNIARAAKAEYAFELKNLYLEDIHIAGVHASCGCTTPRLEKDTLKTYEKGEVIAHINSDRFLGDQGATVTVTIDRPYYAQVQLYVKVHIFDDVLLEPSSAALGSVAQGSSAERTIRVHYTGRPDWRVLEVRSRNPHLTGAVKEASRRDGQIAYDLKVTLDKSAPVGSLNERVWLITNGPQAKHIPVPVEGQVLGAVSVSPELLFLGVVNPGQSVTKQIVVRGQKPFRIVSVHGDCECLRATIPEAKDSNKLYLVPITFTAPKKAGRVSPTIHVETDAGKTVLEIPAHGVVAGS